MQHNRLKIVVFDIDGTLLKSAHLHHDLITPILARDGLDVLFQPWAAYKHYTDRGVIDELIRHFHGRPVDPADITRYDEAFRDALADHLKTGTIAEIVGARRLLDALSALPDVRVCFATGSLRSMATIKLGLLGVAPETMALATGYDFHSREEIVLDAIRQARGQHADFDVVVLGDGIWDERTAMNLGISFVAVQSGTHVFGDGPALVIDDFSALSASQLVALARPFEPSTAEAFMSGRNQP